MTRGFGGVTGIVVLSLCACAEQLPVRVYTTADGLVRDDVSAIRRDSHGYLWFGTGEGVSIFDGNQFTNFTLADGIPGAVRDILETRDGEYWFATVRGLCRFDPKPVSGKHCVVYRFTGSILENQVKQLIERRDGSIWAGTEGGLWRITRKSAAISAEQVPLPTPAGDALRVRQFLEDRDGRLWVGTPDGLFVVESVGEITRLTLGSDGKLGSQGLVQDTKGRIWGANWHHICQIAPSRQPGGYAAVRCSLTGDMTGLFRSSDGKLWVTARGLFEFDPDASGGKPPLHRVVAPSSDDLFPGVTAEDTDGNLWLGGPGAVKLTRHGFTTFSLSDGLRTPRIHAITQDRRGRVCVISSAPPRQPLHVFDGKKFIAMDPYLPPGFEFAWGASQIHFQDHAGEWWVPTLNGLLRFAAPSTISDLARTPPKRVYTVADGLPANITLLLFEDSRHDIWIGGYRTLARWARKTERIQSYGVDEGLPLVTQKPATYGVPQYFLEDAIGDIWVGFYPDGLARYHQGRFQFYSQSDGVPAGQIDWLYLDHRDRLWIASHEGGAARIDDVAAARPAFRHYTTADGLATNTVETIVEDCAGRIYLGGAKGVDRLDPETGSVRHFTAADGLPPARVDVSMRDRSGTLWFGAGTGLSRYLPEPDRNRVPQTPLIRRVRVAGSPLSMSGLGERQIGGLRLGPAQNNLRVEFGSLNFRSGEVLRYQYRLHGGDSEWSAATDDRTVNYSGLAPGTYRFEVRAINGDGLPSEAAASIEFVIVPPLWRRAWAIGIEVTLGVLFIYLAHWYRMRQLLKVERIRTRLASDLHDDIGSGLAEIALLSEVAVAEPGSAGEIATRLGDRARQLREGMSEIVWSVDPHQRSLADLTNRIRQSVYSMLESGGRRVEFEAPDTNVTSGIAVPPDRARQALLICREALTNIARHACASHVSVRLEWKSHELVVDIRDNGCGFDPTVPCAGMGLQNLNRRAQEAGGRLIIDSSPGHGTCVTVGLPLR
jgi:ligand-binding sensor domain-containing protein/two-component sensor histidine kinase